MVIYKNVKFIDMKMKNLITIMLAISFLGLSFAPLNTVSAQAVTCSAGTGPGTARACVPCQNGLYGISVCPDTGIVFSADAEMPAEILATLGLLFVVGSALLINGKVVKNNLE